MKMNTITMLKITDKYKGKFLGFACSYSGAKILGVIDDSTGVEGLLEKGKDILNFYLPSNILMYILIVVTILIYILNFILKKIINAQKPSQKIKKIMKEYTATEISDLSEKTYSWGYNYCIFYSSNPQGWLPDNFIIGEYDNSKYRFGREQENLPGYCQEKYDEYCENSPKIKAILRKGEDRDRFAALHIKPNNDKKNVKIDIKLKKTSWTQLQFSWDYFRLLKNDNEPIESKNNLNNIVQKLKNAFEEQGGKFHLNSFCLHLIIETKKGIVLSRIGKGKENDYPSSWAATIGEQIEESDFCTVNGNDMRYKKDFIECWVKRALEEEFGIDRNEDFEDAFEADSLRVLSVDMEADIYNIALTCVITLKKNFDEFVLEVQDKMDQIENYELIEKAPDEISDILLQYPHNCREYHPSTYLRLLMYYRHKKGTNAINEELVKKYSMLRTEK